MIRQFRRAKGIVRYGIGIDNVDLAAATAAGIIVGHVPSYCLDEVSTHAIAMLLACIRKLFSTNERMRKGQWDVHRDDPVFRVAGKTLGLVGFGQIGKRVARKLAGWDLRLLAKRSLRRIRARGAIRGPPDALPRIGFHFLGTLRS